MPFDAHFVLSLIAPRPLYVASAESTAVFDPIGEFQSALAASPVYRLLGSSGLPTARVPPPNEPVSGHVSYHRRAGKHDVTPFDWEQYLKFCDERLRTWTP